MKWLAGIFIGIVLAVLKNAGGLMSQDKFDYASASVEERQVWMEEGSTQIAAGIEKGLRDSGVSESMMVVREMDISAPKEQVIAVLEAKDGTRLAIPKGFRVEFMDKMCSSWVRTKMGRKGIRMTTRIERSNGDLVRSDTISKKACERFRAFQSRRS